MLKKIAAGAIALALMATSAFSAEVYRSYSGQWKISGYKNGNDMSCVLSTYFDNGATINVNVFPKYDGTQYTTMTIYNPHWDPVDLPMNEPFDGEILFTGKFGSAVLSGQFQIYGSQKVILRSLSGDFSDYFIGARTMILFPDKSEEMRVGLVGTRNATYALNSCINRVTR